jgi:hypothetical protein
MNTTIKNFSKVLLVAITIFSMSIFSSCTKDGEAGATGKDGVNGQAGTNGTNGTNGIDASIQNTGFFVGPNQDRPAQSISGFVKLTLDRELIDHMNAFNPATSELIIPSTGFYHLTATMSFNGSFSTTTGSSLAFFVNGLQFAQRNSSLIGPNQSISLTTNYRLNAGDIITVFIGQYGTVSQTVSTNLGVSSFSGYRVY